METLLEAMLVLASLLLAVLVLLKQLRFLGLPGAPPPATAARRPRPAAGREPGSGTANPSKSIRKRFGASLRDSAMAQSLGVSRGSMHGTPAKSNLNTSLFSPARHDSDPDSLFLELLKIITYDDQFEQSAYGFSLSSKKRPGEDSPWVDKVLAHGPAYGKLKQHEILSRVNSESTKGWSAERAKQAVLASPFRLYLDVVPAIGGDARQEVLYRGTLGRVYVLCQRCKGDEESETSRALLHFAMLLEQARSVADLRDALLGRRLESVSAREKDVCTKILAHAIPSADSATLEPPGGPLNLTPGSTSHLRSSPSAATHQQGNLPGASPLRVSMLVGTPSSAKERENRKGGDLLKTAEINQEQAMGMYNMLLEDATTTKDRVMSMYNTLLKASRTAAGTAQDTEEKLREMRDERDTLHADNKRKDAAISAAKKNISTTEDQMRKERERAQAEREAEVRVLHQQLQEEKTGRDAHIASLHGKLLEKGQKVIELEEKLTSASIEIKDGHAAGVKKDEVLVKVQMALEQQLKAVEEKRAALEEEVAGLREQISKQETLALEDKTKREERERQVDQHTQDVGTILAYLNSVVGVAVDMAQAGKGKGGQLEGDDDVPEFIRAISSRIGPRHPAFLREASNLSAFAGASTSGSQPETPRPGHGEMSPLGMAPRSFSELHRLPAALKSGDSSADLAMPALSDLTAEAVASLFAVKDFIHKTKTVAGEQVPDDEARELAQKLKDAEERCATMDGDLTTAREGLARLESAVKSAEEQRTSMEGELAAENGRLAKANLMISGLESRLKEAGDRLAMKDDDLKEANEKLIAAESSGNMVCELQEELERLKDSEDKTETMHAMEVELKAAREKLLASDDASTRQQELESKLQDAEAQVARVPQLEEELEEVRQKLSVAEASVSVHTELESKIRDLEERLATAEREKEELDNDLFDREAYVNVTKKNVQVRLESISEDLEDLRSKLAGGYPAGSADQCYAGPLTHPSPPSSVGSSESGTVTPSFSDSLVSPKDVGGGVGAASGGNGVDAAEDPMIAGFDDVDAKLVSLKKEIQAWQVSTAAGEANGGDEGDGALKANEMALLKAELQDKDCALEREKREVSQLKDEIAKMDEERQMFENQLSKAEDDAEAGKARCKKFQDESDNLMKQVQRIKDEKVQELARLQQQLQVVEGLIYQKVKMRCDAGKKDDSDRSFEKDDSNRSRKGKVRSAGGEKHDSDLSFVHNPPSSPGNLVCSAATHQGKEPSDNTVEMWSGKYMSGNGHWVDFKVPKLTRDGDKLTGSGSDAHIGPFDIEGQMQGENIEFTKSYVGKRQSLAYQGVLKDGRIDGQYTQAAGGGKGDFWLEVGDSLKSVETVASLFAASAGPSPSSSSPRREIPASPTPSSATFSAKELREGGGGANPLQSPSVPSPDHGAAPARLDLSGVAKQVEGEEYLGLQDSDAASWV